MKVSSRRRVTDGAKSVSPSATTLMAWISSSARMSFSRKPLAPASSASTTYSSMSNVVRIRILMRFVFARQDPGGLDAVEFGHADVHQDDIGMQAASLLDRLAAVCRLADDFDVLFRTQRHLEGSPHERLIVGDRALGWSRRVRVQRQRDDDLIPAAQPRSDPQAASEEADALAHAEMSISRPERIRVRIDRTRAVVGDRQVEAGPLVADRARSRVAGPACFNTLVSASWTMRNAERSSPAGRGRGVPSTVRLT